MESAKIAAFSRFWATVPGHDLNFQNGSNEPNNVQALGWWVAAQDIPTVGQLPTQGTANYSGTAVGSAAYNNGETWATYVAAGKIHMGWDFAERSGDFHINDFRDAGRNLPNLNLSGTMSMPGRLSAINQFSGPLTGNLNGITGSAAGSFVANGADKAAGIIGNWNAANSSYKASGVFGAGRSVLGLVSGN
jgi:hypothetical protein